MLLHGLYSTNRDAEANTVLAQAARKTDFDAHIRDVYFNRIGVFKRVYGSPMPPLEYLRAIDLNLPFENRVIPPTLRYALELAYADRQSGQHTRALERIANLTKLTRILRRDSYRMRDSRAGNAMERYALVAGQQLNLTFPKAPMSSVPLAVYKADPSSLYSYARAHGRTDIANMAASEWSQIQSWIRTNWLGYDFIGKFATQIALISDATRVQMGLLKSLPLALVFGGLFWALSLRFVSQAKVNSLFWRGALVACASMAIVVIHSRFGITYPRSTRLEALTAGDLIMIAPSWFGFGIPILLVCLGFGRASQWQVEQQGHEFTFKARLRQLFSASSRDVVNFDFGWTLGQILRLTFWLVVTFALAAFYYQLYRMPVELLFSANQMTSMLMMYIAWFCLGSYGFFWHQRPNRRASLRLSFRLINQMLAGYLVMASVLYTVVTLTTLPMSLKFEREFEAALQQGELKMSRTEFKLQ